jgi:hypothetical protein
MAYSDFTLQAVLETFNLVEKRTSIFSDVQPLPVSAWLKETFELSLNLAPPSAPEKARSEFIVAPILLEVLRHNPQSCTLYSGKTLNFDPARGLVGECDFILAKGDQAETVLGVFRSIINFYQ